MGVGVAITRELGWQSPESWGGNHQIVGVAITRELGGNHRKLGWQSPEFGWQSPWHISMGVRVAITQS